MKNIFLASSILFLLSACGTKSGESATTEQEMPKEESLVWLSREQYQNSGIQTGNFTKEQVQDFLSAGAELYLGKEHTATVSAIAEGIVSELQVALNQPVRKGDVVAVLYKPDLLDLQERYLREKERSIFLQAEYERYKSLASDNATASKNFQKAESEWRESQTAMALYAARLQQYQIDPNKVAPDQLKTTMPLRAPISGTVTAIHAGTGAALGVGTALCEIADFSRVKPVIYIFEKDMFKVKPGARARLFFSTDPTRKFDARITSMDGMVDRTRNAVRAFAQFDNPVEGLVAGAYMEARIAPEAAVEALVLPETAVIREGEGEFIFLMEKEDPSGFWFRKTEVKTGSASDGKWAIYPVNSLPEDAKAAITGVYYLSAQGSGIEIEE
jgi:cobalt-zinc-cadmium efflux system membrane fusion protein